MVWKDKPVSQSPVTTTSTAYSIEFYKKEKKVTSNLYIGCIQVSLASKTLFFPTIYPLGKKILFEDDIGEVQTLECYTITGYSVTWWPSQD